MYDRRESLCREKRKNTWAGVLSRKLSGDRVYSTLKLFFSKLPCVAKRDKGEKKGGAKLIKRLFFPITRGSLS